MLDGINTLISATALFWQMLIELPFIGQLTWGYFLIACALMSVMVTLFFAKMK